MRPKIIREVEETSFVIGVSRFGEHFGEDTDARVFYGKKESPKNEGCLDLSRCGEK